MINELSSSLPTVTEKHDSHKNSKSLSPAKPNSHSIENHSNEIEAKMSKDDTFNTTFDNNSKLNKGKSEFLYPIDYYEWSCDCGFQ